MRKAKIAGFSALGFILVFGAIVCNSYSRLLAAERDFMPSLASLSTPHDRIVSFYVFKLWSVTRIPHWRVTYRERASTDTRDIDPAITVDLFGHIVDAASNEVIGAVDDAKRHKK